MSQHFFVRRGNQEKGPYSLHDLLAMARKEKLRPTDLVRTPRSHGRSNWRPAGEIKGLFGDRELFEDARRLVGDEPQHPDNREDWWANVLEVYEELLAESIEPAFESDFSVEVMVESEEGDVLTSGDRHAWTADLNSDTDLRADHLPLKKSVAENSMGVEKATDSNIAYKQDSVEEEIANPFSEIQAEWDLARHFIKSGVVDDHAKGMSLLHALAEKGHADSQSLLGFIYWKGQLVPKDFQSASKWFRKAIVAGDGWSMQRLGVMLLNGDEIEKNEDEAFRLFLQAASQGVDEAMNCLAMCYLRGRGTDQDSEKALHWLQSATDLDCEVAQYNLGRRYFFGDIVERDYKKAFALFKLASRWNEKEAPSSEWYIYHFYKDGLGIDRNPSVAVEWIKKGAERECPLAMAELGRLYMNGEGVECDSAQGIQLFRKAADGRDAHAQFYLGIAYLNGEGVPQDDGEAVKWFYLAARQKNKDTDAYVLGHNQAVSSLWELIAPLISDRLRNSLE
jgi:TPR repeat protein